MYQYILYLFGYNDDYYAPPEVYITPSPEKMRKRIEEVLETHKKKDVISKYDLVIEELKQKLKERSNQRDF